MEKLIRGQYRPIEVIGRGGQGRVLKALDERHDRLVAVKVRRVESDAERDAILREARILLNLRAHPNVSLVREDFFARDNYYLVMDWIEGRNLQQVLRESGSPGLPLEDVLRWLAQVADAIDHLHGHDPPIVHKDVKPANIIASSSGAAVLVDFGISGLADVTATRAGTAGYIAPEIAMGQRPAPSADLFGLASTTVALLTGSPPMPGRRPSWDGLDQSRARHVDLAVRRGLAIDPTRRPKTASAFVEMMRTGGGAPGNIPLEMTSFVGREQETLEAESLVAGSRLVTLTGPGGVGKTRLAYQVAGKLSSAYADGVWLVELAGVTDSSFVAQRVASELRVADEADTVVERSLIEHLRTRTLLLVLDNCEHLIAACADLVTLIMRSCAHVRVLTTSREPLGVEGEHVWRVPPLGTAGPDLPLDELMRADAVRLFAERASLVKPAFELTGDTAPIVAEICRKLDGIPLAIELAAARVKMFSLSEILRRLSDRLGLLTTGTRTFTPQHQTLRAAMDWSYALLSVPERTLFARLAVFSGPATLEAVESVCGNGEVLDAISGLVDKSLLTADEVAGETSYSMLQIIHEYAALRLDETGERAALMRKHLEWHASLAARAEQELNGRDQAAWVGRIESAIGNIRAALQWSFREGDDPASGLRICTSLWRFWIGRGYVSEGRSWVEEGLRACGPADEGLCAKAQAVEGVLASEQGDYATAKRTYHEALDIAKRIGDDVLVGWVLNDLGVLAIRIGDLEEASTRFGDSLTVKRRIGDLRPIAVTVGNLGVLALQRGDVSGARVLLEETLSIDRHLGATLSVAHDLYYFGDLAFAEGDFAVAGERYAEALQALIAEPGGRELLPACLEGLAAVAAQRGQHDRVARLAGAADSLRWAMDLPVAPGRGSRLETGIVAARKALGADAFDAGFGEGKALAVEDVVVLALGDRLHAERVQDQIGSKRGL